MKNKIVTRMLACLMVATMVTSLMPQIGAFQQGMVVYAAEQEDASAVTKNLTIENVKFDSSKEWSEVDPKGHNLGVPTDSECKKGMRISYDVLIPAAKSTFEGTIKVQTIFRIGETWTWTEIGITDLTFDSEVSVDGAAYKKATVDLTMKDAPSVAGNLADVTLKIAGYQCTYEGDIIIANTKLEQTEVSDSKETLVYDGSEKSVNSEFDFSSVTGADEDWSTTIRRLTVDDAVSGVSVSNGSVFRGKITIDKDAYDSLTTEGSYIKLQSVMKIGDKSEWNQGVKYPYLDKNSFTDNENGTYSAEFEDRFDEVKGGTELKEVIVCAVGKLAKGTMTVSDVKIYNVTSTDAPLPEKEATVVDDFESATEGDAAGWANEDGWQYTGTVNPVVASANDSKALKLNLDYTGCENYSWSEAKVTKTFSTGYDVSAYNLLTYDIIYPEAFDGFKAKVFAKNAASDTIVINKEGAIDNKEKLSDGLMKATVSVRFTPNENAIDQLTIGTIGVNASFAGNVFIDNIKLAQYDESGNYVKITETVQAGDQAGLDHMATSVKLVDSNATNPTKALAAYLTGLRADDKVLFGHQNSTFRSVKDNGKTSDIKDITGSEAGLFGIDTLALAGTECASENPLEASIAASKKAYKGGSIISLSCHMPNFTNAKITATGDAKHPYDFSKCDFSESKDLTPCADYILEGGEYNAQYNAYLDIIADYALKLQEANVPILFRPFHENSGGWFWWGTSTSADSYRAIWRYMVNYLQAKGVHNLLYVYSPNGPIDNENDYLSRYPGDAYVDVLGFDYYDDYADASKYTGDTYFDALAKSCDVVAGLADKKAKIPAIAETGIRITGAGKDSLMVSGNPTKDKDWYNQVVNTAVEHDIPYFLLWANFDSENFFVPYKYNETMGQEMINDFISAYNNDRSIFGNGTNFYGDNGAISKAGEITLTGYSSNVGGYLISPKNYAVIKDACELKASVKNAAKVTFEIRTSETDDKPLVIEGTKSENSDVYTAQLTADKLAAIPKTGTGVITVVAYGENDTTGTSLGTAKFINFNQDAAVMPSRVFDNFEYYYGNDGLMQTKYGTHNSAAGCSTSVSLDAVNKVEGSYGCAFNYTLAYKGSEAWTGGLGRTFDNKDFSAYNALSMWVKPDGNGQKMVIQLKDSNGKEYEAYLTEFVKGTKAQYVTIPFASFKAKGGTDSISTSDIAAYYLWCNTIPDNIAGDKKDENGNYTVRGSIVFDDIKAVKVSNEDLAKIGEGKTFLTTDAPLTDLSSASQGGSTSGSGSSSVSGGSSAADTTVTNPDGSKTETTVSTNPDGSKTQTTVTTKPDGSKVKTVATANKDGSTVTVTTTTDSKGSTSVKAEVVKTGRKSATGTKGTISSDVVAQITEAAGTTDVVITQKVVDKNGKTAYIVSVNAKDLSAGKKLTLVKYNKKTGKYTLYNKKTYKVTDAGVSQTIKDSGSYQLISEADAAKLVKEILATVKPAKKSKTVKEGNAASFAWSKELDTANVSKITYSSTDNSIAKIGKNGKITAKKAGKVTLKATVTLKNGKKKVVSMKLSVRSK